MGEDEKREKMGHNTEASAEERRGEEGVLHK